MFLFNILNPDSLTPKSIYLTSHQLRCLSRCVLSVPPAPVPSAIQTHSGVLCSQVFLPWVLIRPAGILFSTPGKSPQPFPRCLQIARCSHSPPSWALEPACLQACAGSVVSTCQSLSPSPLSVSPLSLPTPHQAFLTNTCGVSHLQSEGEREDVLYRNTEDSDFHVPHPWASSGRPATRGFVMAQQYLTCSGLWAPLPSISRPSFPLPSLVSFLKQNQVSPPAICGAT